MPTEKLLLKIKILENLNLVRIESRKVFVLKKSMHLPRESAIFEAYRSIQRARGLERMQMVGENKSYSFSTVFSGSEETRREIQENFMKFLKSAEKTVKNQHQKMCTK